MESVSSVQKVDLKQNFNYGVSQLDCVQPYFAFLNRRDSHNTSTDRNGNLLQKLFRAEVSTDPNVLQFANTLMAQAVKNGHVVGMRVLADKGADVNANIPYQGSLLKVAVQNGDVEMVRALRDKGVCLNEEDRASLLAIAVDANNLAMVKVLLEMGVYSNCKNKISGFTPFHVAVKRGTSHMMKELLQNGNGGINEQNCVGETPLHLAAYLSGLSSRSFTNKRMVHLLIENGADPFVKDHRGQSPIDILEERGQRDASQEFKRLRAEYEKPMIKKSLEEHILPELADIVNTQLFGSN